MIRGTPKFDGIAVGEGSFSFLGPTIHLEAKAAFVNSKTGDTHGWTKHTQWSPTVIAALHELRGLMEMDLGRSHMANGGDELVTATSATTPRAVAVETGGLGEMLNSSVPQV